MPANLGRGKYKSKNGLVTYSTGGIPYVNAQGVTVPGMYTMGGAPSMFETWNQKRQWKKRGRQLDRGDMPYEGDLPWFQ